MMMNPAKMNEFHLEWWNHAEMDILTRRREPAHAVMAAISGAPRTSGTTDGGHVDAPATNGDA
jgi:hypothetical protein